MKVLPYLAALLPLAVAIPPPHSTPPLGGREITDPNVLAELQARHAGVLAKMKDGEKVVVRLDDLANYDHDPLQKRNFVILGIAGLSAIIEAVGAGVDIAGGVMANLLSVFMKEDYTIWHSKDNCRAYFQTHSGSEGKFKTWDRGSDNPGTDDNRNIAWINPQSTQPPVHYFENDYLGRYSVQFTATDQVAWGGIEGTEKCPFEGICNPQYVFYHNGYSIILNTWQSQGVVSACQYSHGENCKGLCSSGVRDQFSQNGVVWGGDCAIPCKSDGGDGLPVVSKPAIKVMVAGDSISHGMEADWTWRWRLFAWLQDNLGYKVDFVGPWVGTHGPLMPLAALPQPPLFPGESAPQNEQARGQYADGVPPAFAATGHAAFWGRQVAQTKDTIKSWVAEHQPDYLLILLGFNDLGWFVSGPDDLVGNMGQLVQNAREAKPDVKILMGNVVHRSFIEGRQDLVDNTNRYNQLLRERYPQWFRWESPIAYVDVNANYNCRPEGCPDGYDGLHPNSMGEYHIAQAFARSFKADFGFQGPDFVVPSNPEPRVIRTPSNVLTTSYPEGLHTTWDFVPTARGYDIRSRIQGMTGWWSEGQVYPNTFASWSTWLLDGQTWEFQVRTRGDNDDRSGWSGISTATAHLQTSPGPGHIVAVPTSDGIQISWSPVVGYDVNRYGVIVWDMDTKGSFIDTRAAAGTSLFVGGLKPGHRYGVWVSTYVNLRSSLTGQPYAAGGLPASGRDVIVGAGTPAAPTNLRVTNTDPTTVQLSWTGSAGAVGYAVYVRSVRDNTAFKQDGKTSSTTYGIGFLFPGTWNFEFCVSAYNGDLEGAHTACVIPPVYPGFRKRDEVPGNGTVYPGTSTTMVEDERLPMLYELLAKSAENSGVPLF